MQWFRVWHDMLNDPKWRVISQKSQTRVCEVVSVALAILNSASQNDERGVYTIEAEDMAAALDIDEAAVMAIIAAMEGRFISGGKVINWEKRQPKREDSAAERTKAWRERKRTQCDAPVTQCDAPDKIREDTDKRREEDKELEALAETPTAPHVEQALRAMQAAGVKSLSMPDGGMSKYCIADRVVRVTRQQRDEWQAQFTYIDVMQHLIGISKTWDARLDAGEEVKGWFHATANALKTANQKEKIKKEGWAVK